MKKAVLYTLLSIVFMSIGPTINKFALNAVSPFTLVMYNSLICSVLTLPFIFKKIQKISHEEKKYLLIAGLINSLSMLCLFYGLSKSSPALVSMLNRSYIIFSIFIGAIVLKERISKSDLTLIVFAIIGIILLMFKKEMSQVQLGAFFGLASGLLFSLCNLIIKNKLPKTCNYITLFSINFISSLLFFLICLFKGPENLELPLELKTVSLIFLGSFLGSFLGLLFFYISIKTIPFYKANLYRCISPVVSLLCGFLFFPVSLTLMNKIGLFILLISFIIHTLYKVQIMKNSFQPKNEIEMIKTTLIPSSYQSVLVFVKEDNKWLMVRNKWRSWEFPGGHKENNETPFETARREAYEEAGLDICNLQYVGFYRLLSGHTTLIIKADVEKFHEIPTEFETVERKFVGQFPSSLSFNDAVYPWLVKNC